MYRHIIVISYNRTLYKKPVTVLENALQLTYAEMKNS